MRPVPIPFTTGLAYVLVAVLAVAGMRELWSNRVQASLQLARSSLQAVAADVTATTHAAAAHIRLLQTAAQGELDHPPLQDGRNPLSYLESAGDGRGFTTRRLPADLSAGEGSYVFGAAAPGSLDAAVRSEIEAIQRISPLMADVRRNLPEAGWVYYTSLARFTSLVPYEGPEMADALGWSDDFLTHPLFADTAPERNPGGAIRWHDAYVDQAGKGLLTSVVAPVSDAGGNFRGIVGMDFTIDTLARLLQGPGIDIGTPFIVNRSGQVLAHPQATRSGDREVPRIEAVLPPALTAEAGGLLGELPAVDRHTRGFRVFAADVDQAPWRVMLLVDMRELGWRTLAGMHTELAGLALLALLLVLLELQRRSSDEFRSFKAAVEASEASILITDASGTIEYVNRSFTANTGYSASEAIGKNPRMLKSGHMGPAVYRELWATISRGRSWQGELLNRRKDGELIWERTIISGIPGPDGRPLRYVAVKNDVTEQKSAEDLLRDSEKRFRDLVNTTDGIVWEADAGSFDFTFVSDKAERLLGYPLDEWKQPGFWLAHLHPEDRAWAPEFCATRVSRLEPYDFEYRFMHRDGPTVWLRDLVTVVEQQGRPRWLRGVMFDITESKRMEAELRYSASTDVLTGLPNRRSFFQRLEDELARLQRFEAPPAAVLMLDLDHFKQVNDRYGHAAGDAVLRHFADLLRGQIRRIDLAGRLGGEEFGVILPGSDLISARTFAERLRQKVADTPLSFGNQSIGITVSIGISAFGPQDAGADAVLVRADRALYETKAAGRNRVRVAAGQ